MPTNDCALTSKEKAELAPRGFLLAGIAVGPAASAVWCRRGPDGSPLGVTVDMSREVAARCRLRLELVEFASSGAIVASADMGVWSLSFVPVDAEREKKLQVGSSYSEGVSTFLAREGRFSTIADVNRPGIRVAGIAKTATLRSAERFLTQAEILAIRTLDEAVVLFGQNAIDAVALGEDSALNLKLDVPGSSVVQGHFHRARNAVVAPPKNHLAIAAASRIIEDMKVDGTLRRILDTNGLPHLIIE